jgi:molecular chaperone GrpE (heat shock protein)
LSNELDTTADGQPPQDHEDENIQRPAAVLKHRKTFRELQQELKSQAEQENSGVSTDHGTRSKRTGRAKRKASRKGRPGRDKKGRFTGSAGSSGSQEQTDESVETTPEIEALLCDAESEELDGPVETYSDGPETKPTVSGPAQDQKKLEDSFKTRTEELEKKMAEFKLMAQSVQAKQAAEQARPIEDSIKELTQQMAAIREYASDQQERVQKLQDGYDWNIIRNFCLRIIRCIDNLDNRIEKLLEKNVDTTDLEEIRDEFMFAFECKGVEKFEREVKSEYRGQERSAEAVKDKESCDDPGMSGKVAEVVRPGYQYSIDDEIVKIVRTAQVKLYN